jgi:hypothetical protein
MKNITLFGILLIFLFSCNSGGRVDVPDKQLTGSDINGEVQNKNELDEIRKSIKSETKIKVKKDAKGYSWEITGKDAHEVLKANDILRKKLGD